MRVDLHAMTYVCVSQPPGPLHQLRYRSIDRYCPFLTGWAVGGGWLVVFCVLAEDLASCPLLFLLPPLVRYCILRVVAKWITVGGTVVKGEVHHLPPHTKAGATHCVETDANAVDARKAGEVPTRRRASEREQKHAPWEG